MKPSPKWNRKNVDLSGLSAPAQDEDKQNQLGLKDLFSSKDILIITLVMFFNWPIITMGYFGLGLSMTQLGGNIFIEFILGALVEVNKVDNKKFVTKEFIRSQVTCSVLFLSMFGAGNLSLFGKLDCIWSQSHV